MELSCDDTDLEVADILIGGTFLSRGSGYFQIPKEPFDVCFEGSARSESEVILPDHSRAPVISRRIRRSVSSERCIRRMDVEVEGYDQVLDEAKNLCKQQNDKENTENLNHRRDVNKRGSVQLRSVPRSASPLRRPEPPKPSFRGSMELPRPIMPPIRSRSSSADLGTSAGSVNFLDQALQKRGSMIMEQYPPLLPLLPNTELDSISALTLSQLLLNGCSEFDRVLIFDCRFKYEYVGGHVRGAIHCETEDQWQELLATDRMLHEMGAANRLAIVFYCEFSSKRGPSMWRSLRDWDRKVNDINYPRLHFPQTFLLDKGYSNFWNSYPDLCEPKAYIEMKDPRYKRECSLGMAGLGKSKLRDRSRSEPNVHRTRVDSPSSLAPQFQSISLASPRPHDVDNEPMPIHKSISDPSPKPPRPLNRSTSNIYGAYKYDDIQSPVVTPTCSRFTAKLFRDDDSESQDQ